MTFPILRIDLRTLSALLALCCSACNAKVAPPEVTPPSGTRATPFEFMHDSNNVRVTVHPAVAIGGRVVETPPIYRYVIETPPIYDTIAFDVPPVNDGRAYVGRDDGIYAFNLSTHHERKLADDLPKTPIYISGDALIFGTGDFPATLVSAIRRSNGSRLWTRKGRLIGAGSGIALIVVKVPMTEQNPFGGVLVAVDADRGAARWSNQYAGCRPQPPVTFLPGWALVPWAGPCEVSASVAFLMWFRLRDGAMHDTNDATAVLSRRDGLVFLTGDDRHYGEYGPGNLSVYNVATAKLLRKLRIAPDRPLSAPVAFAGNVDGYALGKNALWVQINNQYRTFGSAVYRYALSDFSAAPGRIDPAFGRWLGAAQGDETYFARGDSVVAIVAKSNGDAVAETYAGRLPGATEAAADERLLYVRGQKGRIAVFNRSTRHEVRLVAAGCDKLLAVRTAGRSRFAVCGKQVSQGQYTDRVILVGF